MRARLWTCHRWLGLILALPLGLVVLSGALLVFAPETERALHPERRLATQAAPGLPLGRLLEGLPERPARLRLPQGPGEPLEVWTGSGPTRRFLDPRTGGLLAVEAPRRGFRSWLFDLHAHLFLGAAGQPILVACGLGLILLATSGVPFLGRRIWRRPGPWTASRWHQALGLISLPGLALLALTGTALVLNKPLGRLVGQPAPPPASRVTGGPADLDAMLRRSEEALPGSRAVLVLFPRRSGDPLTIRRREAEELHPNGRSVVHLDPTTGEVLRVDASSRAPLGRRLLNLAYPLHIGAWGGLSGRLATLAMAGLLAGLVGTGIRRVCRPSARRSRR